jgi:hypothetical protein
VCQEDPHQTVQAFIDLIQRHEQMFYSFVHKVHSRGDGLFDKLMKWIELILTVMRDGIGGKTNLEFLLPHTGKERQDILKEIDEVATYHYKIKVAHEDKVRRRFGRTRGNNDADAEDEATAMLVQGVVNDLSFGELIQGDADEFAAEASSEEDEYSSEYETGEDTDGSDEETSEEDSPPHPRTANPTRSQSFGHSLHAPKRPHASVLASPPVSKGSLDLSHANRSKGPASLRPSRSLNFHSGPGRSNTVPTPPVPTPQIPQKYLNPPPPQRLSISRSPTSGNSASPMRQSMSAAAESPASADGPSRDKRLPSPSEKRKKKVIEEIKPPELKHIPQLLPVFVAMVSVRPPPNNNQPSSLVAVDSPTWLTADMIPTTRTRGCLQMLRCCVPRKVVFYVNIDKFLPKQLTMCACCACNTRIM